LEIVENVSGLLLDGVNPGGVTALTASGGVVFDEFGLGWVEANAVMVGPSSKINDKQNRVVAGLSVSIFYTELPWAPA